MSDIKALPSNLKEIEKKSRFSQVYKNHTVDDLESMLVDIEVDYRSDDNKAALVWRYMDAQGMDFDDAANDRAPEAQNTSNTNDKANSNEDAPTTQNNTNHESAGGGQSSDEGVAGPSADSANAGDDQEPNEVDDATHADAPSDASNSDDDSADEANPTTKTSDQPSTGGATPSDEAAPKQALGQDDAPPESFDEMAARIRASEPHISVKNVGDFDVYEPASRTMIQAGRVTDIYYRDARSAKDKVVRNIKQMNETRGNTLHIINK